MNKQRKRKKTAKYFFKDSLFMSYKDSKAPASSNIVNKLLSMFEFKQPDRKSCSHVPVCRGPACCCPVCRGPACCGPACRGPACRGPACRGPVCRGPLFWPARRTLQQSLQSSCDQLEKNREFTIKHILKMGRKHVDLLAKKVI